MNDLMQMGESAQNLQGAGTVVVVITIVLGILNCFLGYKMLKFWVTLIGLVIGGIVGYSIGAGIGGDSQIIPIIAMLVGGIIVAAIAFKVYLGGVFILCGGLTYLFMNNWLKPETVLIYLICIAAAIAVGVLGTLFVKPVIILSTGILGGLSVGGGILELFNMQESPYGIWIGIAIAVLGVIVQFLANKNRE